VVQLVAKCGESASPDVQLTVIKTLLTITTAEHFRVHGDCLVQVSAAQFSMLAPSTLTVPLPINKPEGCSNPRPQSLPRYVSSTQVWIRALSWMLFREAPQDEVAGPMCGRAHAMLRMCELHHPSQSSAQYLFATASVHGFVRRCLPQ